jgi:type IV pilus assembly protein PilM
VPSFKLTKNFIGLDMGSHSLKIAECQRSGNKVILVNYLVKKWPRPKNPNQPLSREEISLFVRQSLNELGSRASDSVSEITGPWTVTRHLLMPDMADEEMREAIRWGTKSDFPFALDEAIIDFCKFEVLEKEGGEKEAEIVVGVATREVAEEHLALLKGLGLKPLFLSLPAFDLMQVYRLAQPPPASETAAFIDLGHRNTQILILKDGNLKFYREIPVAGDVFTQSLVGTYEIQGRMADVDEVLAEQIKMEASLLEEGEFDPEATIEGIPLGNIQKRLGSVMDRFTLEVERSLTYYKNQFMDYDIKGIFLTGGGSLLGGLPGYLEKNLDLPVHFLEEGGTVAVKKKIHDELYLKNLPFLSTVLGLVSQTQPLINLSSGFALPQERKVPSGNYLKFGLAAALLAGLFLIFGMPYWTASRQVKALTKEMVVKKAQLDRVSKASEELTRLEKEESELDKALEGVPRIQTQPIPVKGLFQELNRMIPANMTLTRLQCYRGVDSGTTGDGKNVSTKPETAPKPGEAGGESGKEIILVFQGVIFGSDQEIINTLNEFTARLDRSLFFKQAKVQNTLKIKEFSRSAAEFKIQAKLGSGPPVAAGGSSG